MLSFTKVLLIATVVGTGIVILSGPSALAQQLSSGKITTIIATENRVLFFMPGASYCSDASGTTPPNTNQNRFFIEPDKKHMVSLLYAAAAAGKSVSVQSGNKCVNDGDTPVLFISLNP